MDRFKLSCLALLFVASGAASAAAVTIKFSNPIFPNLPGADYDNVELTYRNQNGIGTSSEEASAGLFSGSASNLVGVSGSIFVNGINNVLMYCYDIYESIRSGQTVNYQINFNGPTARTLDFLGAVNYVMNGNSNTWKDTYAWVHPVSGLEGAAIQLGIWESLYEQPGNPMNVGSGIFKAEDLEADTSRYLTSFINAMPAANSLESKYAMTLTANGAQDMITADPPAANVPEPASFALMGLALAGLGFARRNLVATRAPAR